MLPWFASGRCPLYLAPMAGFTDVVFRQLCKEHGADVLVSEFVMCDALLREGPRAWEKVDFTPSQRPMGVQLFGADPSRMAEAARLVADRMQPDFIDINFGCPSPKVCAIQAGSAVLKEPPLLGRIAAAMVDRVPEIPITAKIRIGWDEHSVVAPQAAKILASAGVQAVAVHGRTRAQEYRGEANWEVIAEVAESVAIPVIGNGNIRTAGDVLRVRQIARVSGLMIGRAALGNPWIFRQIKEALASGQEPPPPSLSDRWAAMLRYAELLHQRSWKNEASDSITWMRPRLLSFARDFPGSRKLRTDLQQVRTLEELRSLARQSEEPTIGSDHLCGSSESAFLPQQEAGSGAH